MLVSRFEGVTDTAGDGEGDGSVLIDGSFVVVDFEARLDNEFLATLVVVLDAGCREAK